MKTSAKKTKIGTVEITEDNGFIVKVLLCAKEQNQNAETPLLQEAFQQLEEYLNGKRKSFNLPLNPQGTDFQKKIWKELLNINYAETASYLDIATKTGNPKATRATGSACNKNPIPIFIPCHRVIGKNGTLTGFAYGTNLKKYLLDLEQSFAK